MNALQSKITRMREEAVKKIGAEITFIEETLNMFAEAAKIGVNLEQEANLAEQSALYLERLREEKVKYETRLKAESVPYVDELRVLKKLKASGYEF